MRLAFLFKDKSDKNLLVEYYISSNCRNKKPPVLTRGFGGRKK